MNAGDIIGLLILCTSFVGFVALLTRAYRQRLAYLERKHQLENRVRVLERVVTQGENGAEIVRQIEAIFDPANNRDPAKDCTKVPTP